MNFCFIKNFLICNGLIFCWARKSGMPDNLVGNQVEWRNVWLWQTKQSFILRKKT